MGRFIVEGSQVVLKAADLGKQRLLLFAEDWALKQPLQVRINETVKTGFRLTQLQAQLISPRHSLPIPITPQESDDFEDHIHLGIGGLNLPQESAHGLLNGFLPRRGFPSSNSGYDSGSRHGLCAVLR